MDTTDMIKDVQEQLNVYNTTRPRMDELKFVSDLAKKWNVSEKEILKTIREVKRSNRTQKRQV